MPIELIDKIKPKNGQAFTLVDAEDVEFKGGRLSEYIPVALTQEEYNALAEAGQINAKTPYMIVRDETS